MPILKKRWLRRLSCSSVWTEPQVRQGLGVMAPAKSGLLRWAAVTAALLLTVAQAPSPVQAQSLAQAELPNSSPSPSPDRRAEPEFHTAQVSQSETCPDGMHCVWINPGFYSFHWRHQNELRNTNPGLGLELQLTPQWRLTAGRYLNSESAMSNYVGVYYLPVQYQSLRLGVVAGAFSGYPKAWNGGWFPALIPVGVWEGGSLGLQVALVPEYQNRLHGALSFQLKARWP